MSQRLNLGDTAPDFDFITPWKDSLKFYKEAGNKIAILIFLRYIGCPVCQMEMSNLKRNIKLIEGKNITVFVVLQSSPDTVASISNKGDWPFTIICDKEAKIFQLYHVEPGGILKYLNPKGLMAAIKAIQMGNKHGKFEGRETQLPAAFVISRNKIQFAYYGKTINDVPSLESLVNKI